MVRGGIAPPLLTSALDGDVVSFTLRSLNPRYPLGRKLGKPQSRFERCGKKRNLSHAVN
jgi:hypothetical protein